MDKIEMINDEGSRTIVFPNPRVVAEMEAKGFRMVDGPLSVVLAETAEDGPEPDSHDGDDETTQGD